MQNATTFVGMDAHKKSINVAVLLPGESRAVEWQLANTPAAVKKLIRKLAKMAPGAVRCCYEAGPCGYALQRQFAESSIVCEVVAPSLVPRKPGERIKTDRRDAKKLAELYRAGLLTEVRPPTAEDEAARDLTRCREDAQEDLTRARHRLLKLLVRRGLVYDGNHWTAAHRAWLKTISFEAAAERVAFEDYRWAIEQGEQRLARLDAEVEKLAETERYSEAVGKLRCFRGVDTITAMTLLTELHSFERFASPRQLMAFVGLVPSEHSSSEAVRRGGITKTGNSHVRRVLIEAAWHYRRPPHIGKALAKRRQGQPAEAVQVADKAQRRLHDRHWRMVSRKKPANKVVTAVARELVGFLWAALQPTRPQGSQALTGQPPAAATTRQRAAGTEGAAAHRRSGVRAGSWAPSGGDTSGGVADPPTPRARLWTAARGRSAAAGSRTRAS